MNLERYFNIFIKDLCNRYNIVIYGTNLFELSSEIYLQCPLFPVISFTSVCLALPISSSKSSHICKPGKPAFSCHSLNNEILHDLYPFPFAYTITHSLQTTLK